MDSLKGSGGGPAGKLPETPDPKTGVSGETLSAQEAHRTTPRATASVLAVVVARDHAPNYVGPSLEEVVASVCGQSVPPERLVVVDASVDGDATGALGLPWGEPFSAVGGEDDSCPTVVTRVFAPGASNFGEAINRGLGEAGGKDPDWYWLLHDDMVAQPGALRYLLDATIGSRMIAVVGPKQVEYGAQERLLSLGTDATKSARRLGYSQPDEIDQGQHDAREDVLAVGTAGALVRSKVWNEIGGLDPALGPFGDGLEFGRRVHLAGHRVVVAPKARVEHAQSSFGHEGGGQSSFSRRRAEQLYNWLAALPAWMVFPTLLWLPFLTAGRATARLGAGKAGLAGAEVSGYFQVLGMTPALFRARRRISEVSVVPRATLNPLTADAKGIRAQKRTSRRIRSDKGEPVAVSYDVGALDLLRTHSLRTAGALLGLLVLMSTLSVLAFYPYFTGVQGGSWGALPASWSTLVDQAFSGWQVSGDGSAGPSSPLLAVLAVLCAPFALVGVSPNQALLVLFFAALPLAAWGGWAVAGSLTRSPVTRFAVGVLWAASPVFLVPLIEGDAASIILFLALPGVFVGLWRALTPRVSLRAGGANDVVKVKITDRVAWLAFASFSTAAAAAAAPMALPIILVFTLLLVFATSRKRRVWDDPHAGRPPGKVLKTVSVVLPVLAGTALIAPSVARAARGGADAFLSWLGSPIASPQGLTTALGLPKVLPVAPEGTGLSAALSAGQFLPIVFYVGLAGSAATLAWGAVILLFDWLRKTPPTRVLPFWFAGLLFLGVVVAQSSHPVGVAGVPYAWMVAGYLAFLAVIPASQSHYSLPAYSHKVPGKVRRAKWARRLPATLATIAGVSAVTALLILGPTGPFHGWAPKSEVSATGGNVFLGSTETPQSANAEKGDTEGASAQEAPAPEESAQQESGPGESAQERGTENQDAQTEDGRRAQASTVAALIGKGTQFIEPAASPPIPRISMQAQEDGRRARLLTIDATGRQVRAGLLRGPGITLADLGFAGDWDASGGDGELASTSLASAVAALTTYPSPDAANVLAQHAVDAVLVATSSGGSQEVTNTLDAVDGLERIGSVEGGVLWRVRPADVVPSRVSIESSDGEVSLVESGAVHVHENITVESPSTLVLSEVADEGWKATFNGDSLEPVALEGEGAWRQAFTIPAGEGVLDITYQAPYLLWWWGALALLGVAALVMAIPWRVRPAVLVPIENPVETRLVTPRQEGPLEETIGEETVGEEVTAEKVVGEEVVGEEVEVSAAGEDELPEAPTTSLDEEDVEEGRVDRDV